MADLEAVLADVSYLMAMEKSKSTPAASASKKIILPDRRWVFCENCFLGEFSRVIGVKHRFPTDIKLKGSILSILFNFGTKIPLNKNTKDILGITFMVKIFSKKTFFVIKYCSMKKDPLAEIGNSSTNYQLFYYYFFKKFQCLIAITKLFFFIIKRPMTITIKIYIFYKNKTSIYIIKM